MTHYTWDGMRLFQKIETAAAYALDHDKNPDKLMILDGGQLMMAARFEIEDLLAHMRDQAPPC